MGKNIFLIICFYFLTLLQSSFFPHFPFGSWWNLVLVSVIIINLLEHPREKTGFLSAFFGGLLLDIFSEHFIGFWVLILLTLTIFIKFIFKKYVRCPTFRRLSSF